MILTGQPLDYVIGLDVLTFNALCTVLNRVHYREKLQDAWVSAAATSVGMTGKDTALVTLEESWEDVLEMKKQRAKAVKHYEPKKAAKGQSDFLSMLTKGGMKGGKF